MKETTALGQATRSLAPEDPGGGSVYVWASHAAAQGAVAASGDAGTSLPVPLTAVVERALENLSGQSGGRIHVLVLGGTADLRIDKRFAVAGIDCVEGDGPMTVVDAARRLRTGAADAVVLAAVDGPDWASLTLVSAEAEPAGVLAVLTGAGEGSSLAAAIDVADIDPTRIGLVAAQASNAGAVSRLLEQWADETPRSAAVLPLSTAVTPLSPVSAARSLAAVCAVVEALATRSLPPHVGAEPLAARGFSTARHARPWISGDRRVAAAMASSGGRVAVVTFADAPAARNRRRPPKWDAALVLLAASSREALTRAAAEAASAVAANPQTPLAVWAERLSAGRDPSAPARAAVIARDTHELATRLGALAAALPKGTSSLHLTDGTAFADRPTDGKVALLFPGQGAQFLGMFGELCLSLPTLHEWIDRLQASYPAMEYCPPSALVAPPTDGLTADEQATLERAVSGLSRGAMVVMFGTLALARVLARAGVRPDAIVGYSNGENAALIAGGAWHLESCDELLTMMHVVRLHDEDAPVPRGASIAVNMAPADLVARAIEEAAGTVAVALENCPGQCVLFGTPAGIDRVAAVLRRAGAIVVPLAFDRGHHTPAYAPTVERLRPVYKVLDFRPPLIPMYSCVLAAPFPEDAEGVRECAISQWARTVRFGATIERMYADGVRTFIEVGPGSMLTGFVRNTLRGRPHDALTTHVPGRPALPQLLQLLGRLHVMGQDIDPLGLTRLDMGLSLVPDVSPASARAEASLPDASARSDSRPAPPLPHVAPAAPRLPLAPGSVGPVVEGHFDLMRRFLDQQARVHEAFLASGRDRHGVASAPTPAVSAEPLLGGRVRLTPGRLVAHRRFDQQSDLFLRHHVFGPADERFDRPRVGLPVVPFMVSLELAAEAAARLRGRREGPLQLRGARGLRWLALDGGFLDLQVEAETTETRPGRHEVHVRFHDVTAGDARASFEAFVPTDDPVPDLPLLSVPPSVPDGVALVAQYNDITFHGPMFLLLREVIGLDDTRITVRVAAAGGDGYLAGGAAALETSVGILDAATQAVSLCLWRHREADISVFPVGLDRYVEFHALPHTGDVFITAHVTRGSGAVSADFDVTDGSGRRLAHGSGLGFRPLPLPPALQAFCFGPPCLARLSASVSASPPTRELRLPPPDILDGAQEIWLRTVVARALTADERRAWHALDRGQRKVWLSRRIAAKEVALDVLAARGVVLDLQDLTTHDEGDRLSVRAPQSGLDESFGVTLEPRGESLVATLAGTTIGKG